MHSRLCIKFKYQQALPHKATNIMDMLFLDVPCGTTQEEHIYKNIIQPYLDDIDIQQLESFVHHHKTTRLMHSLHVSYLCFLFAYRHNWDYHSAAVGGILHDFVLMSRETYKQQSGKWWILQHPECALRAAQAKYQLDATTQDIIQTHMFPLSLRFPRYKEAYLIAYWDKYCAIRERFQKQRRVENGSVS